MTTKKPTPPRYETPPPPGVKGSYGTLAIDWAARKLGIVASPWQARVITAILRHDKHGNLLARTALISTGRQNGKSVVVRVIVGWLLDEGRYFEAFAGWTSMLLAAHDAKQARIVYRGVYRDMLDIWPQRERKHADQRVTEYFGIQNGPLMLDTVTAQPGSARGLSAGLIAWDEVLTQRDFAMYEALGPTQSAQRSPIMLLTSTAGTPESVLLRAFYDRLVRQSTGSEAPDPTFYGAWWQATDPDAGLDWRQLELANPSLNDGRLQRAAIVTEHGVLPADSWRRERLNHWVDTVAPGAFDPAVWARCRMPDPLVDYPGPFTMGVDVAPDWQRATIVVAGVRPDGRLGAAVWRDLRTDEAQLTGEKVTAAVKEFPGYVSSIGFDGYNAGAPIFRRHAEETGLPWQEYLPSQMVRACMDTTEMILAGRLAVGDPLIDAQIPLVGRRPVGQEGAYRFSRTHSLGPIDAVLAMTLAAHASAYPAAMGGFNL